MSDKLKNISRRRFLWRILGGTVILSSGGMISRILSQKKLSSWNGVILNAHEAAVLAAAIPVILPDLPPPYQQDVLQNIDRYLSHLPPPHLQDVHLLFAAVAQLTLACFFALPFSRLTIVQRQDYLVWLSQTQGQLRLCYQGLRDLCMLGYYQMPVSWEKIGYTGPMVASERIVPPIYADMIAPRNIQPRAMVLA